MIGSGGLPHHYRIAADCTIGIMRADGHAVGKAAAAEEAPG